MKVHRKTIANIVAIEGVGLHSGIYTRLELHPAAAGDGIQFVRTDLRNLRVPALQASTTALDYATSVGKDDVSIGTVEHLLSALVGCGITDVDLLIDGPEVPIIDGSALPFVHLIDAAGVKDLDEMVPVMTVSEPIEIRDGDKTISIRPADSLSVHYEIDFNHPTIGRQCLIYRFDAESFIEEIAPARTFGFISDVEKLRALGLARGGSVENCIVLGDDGVTNGDLRFHDEFVRHKILDLIGDLALLGIPLVGEIRAYKAGHALHSRFVEQILEQKRAAAEAAEGRTDARRPQLYPA